ncbi:uncharacterized protein [Haliotis asinina]|uniref:uncharacterized protein n=1 Tax=Haliotis asinina TaxID=109174 RepID=UPI003531C4BE
MDPKQSGSTRNEKKRRLDEIDQPSGHISPNADSWARFLVIEGKDKQPLKLNPFAVSKAISGICGEVSNVTRLRSGSLLVECARRQQSLNLISIKTFANVEAVVSVHRTLNSCRGIIRDKARCLSDMSEEDIATELREQAVTSMKRFTAKREGVIINTNTYLLTFSRSSIPTSIKAGYFNIGVEVYVSNPLRCYKCQKFGHGSQSCRNAVVCQRCGDNHEDTNCQKDPRCANCDGSHPTFSKSCPVWQREAKIMKLKCEKNISYFDAKKLLQNQNSNPLNLTYSAAVSRPVATSSIACQTDLTWVMSERPVVSNASPQSAVIASTSRASQSTCGSQTESLSENQPDTSSSQPVTTNSNKRKEKKLNRNQTPTNPSPPEVPLENTFGPLDMEVTLSSQDKQRKSSSRSRERSPIVAP